MGAALKAGKIIAFGVLAAVVSFGQHSGVSGGGFHGGGAAFSGGFHAATPLAHAGGSRFGPAPVPGSIPSYGPNAYPGALYGANGGRSGNNYGSGYSYGSGRNRGNSGYRHGHRDYDRFPVTYFFAPYYYPFLDYGSSPYYGDYDNGYDAGPGPGYDAGPEPYAQGGDPATADQLAQLNAQVNDLRNGLRGQPPPSPYPVPPYSSGAPDTTSPSDQTPPPPPVTVVLNGGQSLQVQNYAVMNGIFWDFSRQPARKIPVSTIDIPASVKATEANGAEFPLHSGQ